MKSQAGKKAHLAGKNLNKIIMIKKFKISFLVLVLALASSIILVGCDSQPTVSQVVITPDVHLVAVGGTAMLSASVIGENNPSQAVTWLSSNSNIATVSAQGVVSGYSEGNVIITATSTVDESVIGAAIITVRQPIDHEVRFTTTLRWEGSGILFLPPLVTKQCLF